MRSEEAPPSRCCGRPHARFLPSERQSKFGEPRFESHQIWNKQGVQGVQVTDTF